MHTFIVIKHIPVINYLKHKDKFDITLAYTKSI